LVQRFPPKISGKKRWLLFGLTILVVLAITAFVLLQNTDEAPKHPRRPAWMDGYGPPTTYPVLYNFAPNAVDLTQPKTFPALTYGIQTFFWWDESYRNFGLTQINIMQFSHVRQDFAWADIEPEKRAPNDPNRYVWAQADPMVNDIEAKGIKIVARLNKAPVWAINASADYTEPPFDLERLREYCNAVATRYQGRIVAYQVWNEPNLTREWANLPPSPVGYVKLLAACAEAIRAADPEAVIITAGMAPTGTRDASAMPDDEFFWRMYEAGASPYFDVLGVHAPGYKLPPEVSPDEIVVDNWLRWHCFRHVEDIRAVMVANGDAAKQIAITEVGWTIDPRPDSGYSWFAVTPEQQGDYLARAYRYAADHWRPWVGLMVALYYPNPGWTQADEEYWWAIGEVIPLPFGMHGRPAWSALVQMRKISTNPDYDHPARDAFFNPIDE
jgi:hypothetical protein